MESTGEDVSQPGLQELSESNVNDDLPDAFWSSLSSPMQRLFEEWGVPFGSPLPLPYVTESLKIVFLTDPRTFWAPICLKLRAFDRMCNHFYHKPCAPGAPQSFGSPTQSTTQEAIVTVDLTKEDALNDQERIWHKKQPPRGDFENTEQILVSTNKLQDALASNLIGDFWSNLSIPMQKLYEEWGVPFGSPVPLPYITESLKLVFLSDTNPRTSWAPICLKIRAFDRICNHSNDSADSLSAPQFILQGSAPQFILQGSTTHNVNQESTETVDLTEEEHSNNQELISCKKRMRRNESTDQNLEAAENDVVEPDAKKTKQNENALK